MRLFETADDTLKKRHHTKLKKGFISLQRIRNPFLVWYNTTKPLKTFPGYFVRFSYDTTKPQLLVMVS
jgi:hypothetical protein